MSNTAPAINEMYDLPENNGLTPQQEEALRLLQEECAELIKAASKVLRAGMDFVPYRGTEKEDGSFGDQLVQELGDVLRLSGEVCEVGLVTDEQMTVAANLKAAKLKRWSKYLGRGFTNDFRMLDME